MEIQNEIKHKNNPIYKKKKFLHTYTHTMKIINFLQQSLPRSYLLYIKLGTVVKKL